MNTNDLFAIIREKEVQLMILRAEYKKLAEHHDAHDHRAPELEKE